MIPDFSGIIKEPNASPASSRRLTQNHSKSGRGVRFISAHLGKTAGIPGFSASVLNYGVPERLTTNRSFSSMTVSPLGIMA